MKWHLNCALVVNVLTVVEPRVHTSIVDGMIVSILFVVKNCELFGCLHKHESKLTFALHWTYGNSNIEKSEMSTRYSDTHAITHNFLFNSFFQMEICGKIRNRDKNSRHGKASIQTIVRIVELVCMQATRWRSHFMQEKKQLKRKHNRSESQCANLVSVYQKVCTNIPLRSHFLRNFIRMTSNSTRHTIEST